jgi:hypothetical protein
MSAIADPVEQSNGVLDLTFAGIKWRLQNHCDGLTVCTDPRTTEFLATDDRVPDAVIDVRWSREFDAPGQVSFDAGLWRTYSADEFIFDFHTEKLGPQPYKRAIFHRDFSRGEVKLNQELLRNEESYYPFEYPLDELAMMHRLALGHGVELHSCGLATSDGRGYLFVGHSGAGKSTLGKLWVAERNARILSDDRVIVTRQGNSFRIHGTPWHGEAGLACNAHAELKAIFLIQHGTENELVRVNPAQASAELFARSFVPWYRPEALGFSLGFMQSIVTEIPIYIFRCVPNPSAIEFLEANCAI